LVEVERSALVDAPYNPRVMSDAARGKLRAGLTKFGLLAPVVWNARTGHVVSGHQRLRELDGLHGAQTYRLKVAKVDLDPVAEKEANILLNNFEAMGEWDIEKLADVVATEGFNVEAAGFDQADIFRILGDVPAARGEDSAQALDAIAQRLRAMQERYATLEAQAKQRDGTDYYLVVVFRDETERSRFVTRLGLEDNRYQDGRRLFALLKNPPTAAVGGSTPSPAPIPSTTPEASSDGADA
jgi:hypothetical protein